MPLEAAPGPRRFYAIAHRCNVAADLVQALRAGANAIECDVRWDEGLWVKHPPDLAEPMPEGTPLDAYLEAAKRAARDFEHLSLLIFDLKDSVAREHVEALLKAVRAELAPAGTNVILSVAEFERRGVFDGLPGSLGPREAIGIDEDDDPDRVARHFAAERGTRGCYGNGVDAQVPDFLAGPVEASIRRALELRDTGTLRFVYRWTLNSASAMRTYLDLNVDGIMTDRVDELVATLREPPYDRAVRLAGRDDLP